MTAVRRHHVLRAAGNVEVRVSEHRWPLQARLVALVLGAGYFVRTDPPPPAPDGRHPDNPLAAAVVVGGDARVRCAHCGELDPCPWRLEVHVCSVGGGCWPGQCRLVELAARVRFGVSPSEAGR